MSDCSAVASSPSLLLWIKDGEKSEIKKTSWKTPAHVKFLI